MTSIKKNFAYKSALTLSSYIVAFITFPYVSRILGVERIGLVDFVDNTVNYFLLFASMGINLLGIREIAAVKENTVIRSVTPSHQMDSDKGIDEHKRVKKLKEHIVAVHETDMHDNKGESKVIGKLEHKFPRLRKILVNGGCQGSFGDRVFRMFG